MDAKPKNSYAGLIHHDFLLIFIHGADPDGPGEDYVSPRSQFAPL
jgi:hypothetical protein